MDAVTGRWSGGGEECVYQCHIRASAGRDGVMNVHLDIMISPGVYIAFPPVTANTHSVTTTQRLSFRRSPAHVE